MLRGMRCRAPASYFGLCFTYDPRRMQTPVSCVWDDSCGAAGLAGVVPVQPQLFTTYNIQHHTTDDFSIDLRILPAAGCAPPVLFQSVK